MVDMHPTNNIKRALPLPLVLAVVLLTSAGGNGANAQDWAKAMFNQTSHDFGVVARGAKVEHRFTLENIYEEDVHIKNVTSSCGCSIPKATKQLLKTWEKSDIVVTVDTRGFLGQKDATIEVEFDQPFPAKAQLHVHTYIRGDVVVQPGVAEFGAVNQGTAETRNLKISYAGRADWRIDRVECANPHIEAHLAETSRTPTLIKYELAVKLKEDAPSGYVKDQLFLVTNDFDTRAARVPVPVEGLVLATLTVRPSPLMMGTVEPGQHITRNVVIQGHSPFHVLAARAGDNRFQCKPPSEAKTIHILPVTFSAADAKTAAGTVATTIRLETDLPGAKAVEVNASVEVQAAKPPL
jgi:hypothetical protein